MAEMKCCTSCKVEKPLEDFHRNRSSKSGRAARCKDCAKPVTEADFARKKALRKSYYERNKERERQYRLDHAAERARWYAENAEKKKASDKRWRQENTERSRAGQRAWREKQGSELRIKQRAYHHRPDIRERRLKRNAERTVERAAVFRSWAARNRDQVQLLRSFRRVAKYRGTLPCLTPADKAAIRECYRTAEIYRELFALDVQVDHVIPLQGRDVSGLHVPWNLRILPRLENIRKGNRWSETEVLSPTLSWEDVV